MIDCQSTTTFISLRTFSSKGHCVEALFTVLEARGILPKDELDSLGHFGSPLAGHPTSDVPGIEVSSGALGHGLPIGVGMALAAKMDGCIAVTKVPNLQKLMKHVCRNGFEHHVAACRKHVAGILQDAIENYLGWDLYVHE